MGVNDIYSFWSDLSIYRFLERCRIWLVFQCGERHQTKFQDQLPFDVVLSHSYGWSSLISKLLILSTNWGLTCNLTSLDTHCSMRKGFGDVRQPFLHLRKLVGSGRSSTPKCQTIHPSVIGRIRNRSEPQLSFNDVTGERCHVPLSFCYVLVAHYTIMN